jgi:2-isopropylmalate synthase
MEPHSVGVPETKLVLGKHSGRHALAQRCEVLLGTALTKDQLDTMYHRFTALADRKKGLSNPEIASLARAVVEETKASAVAAD